MRVRGSGKPVATPSAETLVHRERQRDVRAMLAVRNAHGEDDAWLARRLGVTMPRLSALLSAASPTEAEREKIRALLAESL